MLKKLSYTVISAALALALTLPALTPTDNVPLPEPLPCYPPQTEQKISDYDAVMRSVGDECGVDWRLLSAIACIESQFRSDAVSPRGAVGLMQIMPSIGEHFDIPCDSLPRPYYNVKAAAALLCEIESMMQLPETVSERDRLSLVLASYNSGIGHVSDARRLARAFGENFNSWATVSHYLRLKNEPEYYEHDVVVNGQFKSGRTTTAYVRDVLKRYHHYLEMTGDAAEERTAESVI